MHSKCLWSQTPSFFVHYAAPKLGTFKLHLHSTIRKTHLGAFSQTHSAPAGLCIHLFPFWVKSRGGGISCWPLNICPSEWMGECWLNAHTECVCVLRSMYQHGFGRQHDKCVFVAVMNFSNSKWVWIAGVWLGIAQRKRRLSPGYIACHISFGGILKSEIYCSRN